MRMTVVVMLDAGTVCGAVVAGVGIVLVVLGLVPVLYFGPGPFADLLVGVVGRGKTEEEGIGKWNRTESGKHDDHDDHEDEDDD